MDPDEILQHAENNLLVVLVKPNASKNKIIGWDESLQALRISIAAVPDKNKANKELIRFLSKFLRRKIQIKSGSTNRKKLLALKQ